MGVQTICKCFLEMLESESKQVVLKVGLYETCDLIFMNDVLLLLGN